MKEMKLNFKTSELHLELRKQVKGFKGELGSLVKPIHERFEIPLKIAFGQAINYLVVDKSDSAFHVNRILKEKGLKRILIILDSLPDIVKEREIASAIRSKLLDIGNYALDTIDYQKNIKNIDNAISLFLSGKVFCDDIYQLKQLKEKGIPQIKQIITVDGITMNNRTLFKGFGNKKLLESKPFGTGIDMEVSLLENEISEVKANIHQNHQRAAKINLLIEENVNYLTFLNK